MRDFRQTAFLRNLHFEVRTVTGKFMMIKWRGQGGGNPGEQGAGGVRQTGEERAGSRREIQKGRKRSLFIKVLLIIQSKTQTQPRFLTSI